MLRAVGRLLGLWPEPTQREEKEESPSKPSAVQKEDFARGIVLDQSRQEQQLQGQLGNPCAVTGSIIVFPTGSFAKRLVVERIRGGGRHMLRASGFSTLIESGGRHMLRESGFAQSFWNFTR